MSKAPFVMILFEASAKVMYLLNCVCFGEPHVMLFAVAANTLHKNRHS